MAKTTNTTKSTTDENAADATELKRWKKIVGKVRTLAHLGLTPIRAYGLHELTEECARKTTPADFEEQVALGKLRIVYWSFGLIVAIDHGDNLDEIGHVESLACSKGGRGPIEVHELGYVDDQGEFVDAVEMAGSDLTLPFTRALLPVEVMDGQRGAL